MDQKQSFNLPDIFETTIFGVIEIVRRYLITSTVLLFRPKTYTRWISGYYQSSGPLPEVALSRPLTFLLISFFLGVLAGHMLADIFHVTHPPYIIPPIEQLSLKVLIIYFSAPLAILMIVYGLFSLLFYASGIKINFHKSVILLAYPLGILLIYIPTRSVFEQLVPQPWLGLIAGMFLWIFFRRIYQVVGDLYIEKRRRFKWVLISFLGVILIPFVIMAIIQKYVSA